MKGRTQPKIADMTFPTPCNTIPTAVRKSTWPQVTTPRPTVPDVRRRRTDGPTNYMARYKSKIAPSQLRVAPGYIPRRAVSVYTLVSLPLVVVIEDRRPTGVGVVATEIRVLLKRADDTRYWADPQMVADELQMGPSRITG